MLRSRMTLPAVAVAAAGAAAAAAALSVTAGCSAGFDATSTQPYAPSDGVLADSGDIRVLNALVVASEGATSGVLSMAVANRGTRGDRLTGITSPHGTVSSTASSGPVDLPAGSTVPFGAPDATVTGLTRRTGETVTLKLTFARTQPITLRTVVVPAEGDYASITPAPSSPAVASPST